MSFVTTVCDRITKHTFYRIITTFYFLVKLINFCKVHCYKLKFLISSICVLCDCPSLFFPALGSESQVDICVVCCRLAARPSCDSQRCRLLPNYCALVFVLKKYARINLWFYSECQKMCHFYFYDNLFRKYVSIWIILSLLHLQRNCGKAVIKWSGSFCFIDPFPQLIAECKTKELLTSDQFYRTTPTHVHSVF